MVSFVFLISCGSEITVIGKWEFNEEGNETNASMDFKEDGTCDQVRGVNTRTVDWVMSEDKKSIDIIDEDGRIELMADLELTADELSFNNGYERMTFVKVK